MCFLRNKRLVFAALALAAFLLFWLFRPVRAFDQLGFTIGKLESTGWRAEQLKFSLEWSAPDVAAYRLEIGSLAWGESGQLIHGIRIDCLKGELSDQRLGCSQGRAHLPWDRLDDPAVELSFTFEPSTGELQGSLRRLALAGGHSQVDFHLSEAQWEVSLRGQGLQAQALPALLPLDLKALAGWTYSGELNLQAHLSGREASLLKADWRVEIKRLGFSDDGGEYAGDGLTGELSGRLEHAAGPWRMQQTLSLKQGELLSPVCYLNAKDRPLELTARFSLDEDLARVNIEDARLALHDLAFVRASADLDLVGEQRVRRFSLQSKHIDLDGLYRELLQPVLIGTPWGSFELAGSAGLELSVTGETMAVDLSLEDVQLDDAEAAGSTRRVGLYDLNGQLHWNQGGTSRPSRLSWGSGQLLERIDVGASSMEFQAQEREFKLLRQLRLPVIDGALVVDRLDIEALGSPEQKIRFDGIIEPITMAALSEALGWQPLSGKLSGMIPGLNVKQGRLAIEGALLVRMFDGDILIRQLQLQDLFGVYPQLQADIELHSLDLETLTNTFSFGRITGRLDGYVRGLRLENWQPVAFDARFYTPEDDKSRHRISQRAVDNISNLGGAGLSGTLARSFLGVFEEFRYKRIGIGCRLKNGTCDMVGAGAAKQGYYLVEGSGIPRIDIIGYNRTADWNRLVEQLKQITRSGSPVID